MCANRIKTECERCGTCCTKGGPALHREDKLLLTGNNLSFEHLVTIRQGEPVFSLTGKTPQAAPCEIIKIKGQGSAWTCMFFDEKNARCSIYKNRPLECSLLKCWDTTDLESIAGQNLLARIDLIGPGNQVLPFIEMHETECSLADLAQLLAGVFQEDSRSQALADLEKRVNTDLEIRAQACAKLHCSLDLELFYFGRPLFMILAQYGIQIHEDNGRYMLSVTLPENPA